MSTTQDRMIAALERAEAGLVMAAEALTQYQADYAQRCATLNSEAAPDRLALASLDELSSDRLHQVLRSRCLGLSLETLFACGIVTPAATKAWVSAWTANIRRLVP